MKGNKLVLIPLLIALTITGLIVIISDPGSGIQGKTFWDFLQLAIMPLVLLGLATYFSHQQKTLELNRAEKNEKLQKELNESRVQEDRIDAYLNKMSDLLVNKKLGTSKRNDPTRITARALTGWIFARIASHRKGFVLRFLYEARLLTVKDPKISLVDVDLKGAYLASQKLSGINLRGAFLSGSNFMFADLKNSNLSETYFSEGSFWGTNLSHSNLRGAVISGTKMRECDFSYADFSGARLNGADLTGANLLHSNISKEQIKQIKSLDHAKLPPKFAKRK